MKKEQIIEQLRELAIHLLDVRDESDDQIEAIEEAIKILNETP